MIGSVSKQALLALQPRSATLKGEVTAIGHASPHSRHIVFDVIVPFSHMIRTPTTREHAMHSFSYGGSYHISNLRLGAIGFHPTKNHLEGRNWYTEKLSF